MKVTVLPGSLAGSVPAVASKSYAHRLLICAALSRTPSLVACRTASADIRATAGCLRALGAVIGETGDGFAVTPIGQAPDRAALDCGESGSTLRLLLPVCAALGADCSLTLRGRLARRPLSPLYEELCRHGATLSAQGVSPLRVGGKLTGRDFTIRADVSSQFASGLLLALPLLGGGTVTLDGPVESGAYIDITAHCMRLAGVDVRREGNRYAVSGGYDAPRRAEVEGDWSNAAFWLCAGTLGTAPVSVTGLNPSSLQGDRRIVDIIRDFGGGVTVEDSLVTAFPARIRGCRVDAGDVPDLVPIVSVLGALAAGETRIVNAGRLRLKESDRLAAVENVLSALGAAVSQMEDGLLIRGGTLRGAAVDAWNDHRIAMSAAIAALSAAGAVTIAGAECVNKSYPGFFDDFRKLGGFAVKE